MLNNNLTLREALIAKNDEYYTFLPDIEKELAHYSAFLKGKIVYCNCDDPEKSNFVKYFIDNFSKLSLKELIATSYEENGHGKLLKYNGVDKVLLELDGDGDFASEECIKLLKESDVVITNPPFSLFRPYFALLTKYDKKFLVIGNMNIITFKEIFPYFKENKVWLGTTRAYSFLKPNGEIQKSVNTCWYTNIKGDVENKSLKLTKTFVPENYPKYDNFDAIDCRKIVDIPMDYDDLIGVPVSLMCHHYQDQFELVGIVNHGSDNEYDFCRPKIGGKEVFKRLIIRRIKK